jgi:hypothetical protein
MKLKRWQKNGLSVVVIVAGGFALFNLMFMLLALVVNAGNALTRAIAGADDFAINGMFWRGIFVVVLLVASWLILRGKLNDLFKATYLTAPLMVLYVLIGIALYGQPQWLILGVGAAVAVAVLSFLAVRKLSWLYFAATIYVTIVAAYVAIAGVDI